MRPRAAADHFTPTTAVPHSGQRSPFAWRGGRSRRSDISRAGRRRRRAWRRHQTAGATSRRGRASNAGMPASNWRSAPEMLSSHRPAPQKNPNCRHSRNVRGRARQAARSDSLIFRGSGAVISATRTRRGRRRSTPAALPRPERDDLEPLAAVRHRLHAQTNAVATNSMRHRTEQTVKAWRSRPRIGRHPTAGVGRHPTAVPHSGQRRLSPRRQRKVEPQKVGQRPRGPVRDLAGDISARLAVSAHPVITAYAADRGRR